MKRNESNSLKLAQEYVISKGYKGELKYLKQWNGHTVYEILGLPDDDCGEPLVVTVSSIGDCHIKSYFKVLSSTIAFPGRCSREKFSWKREEISWKREEIS